MVAAIAGALHSLFGVPTSVAVGMVGLMIVLDLLLYPLFRHSYAARSHTGTESWIGQSARVEDGLAPRGYVRIRGERWQARLADPSDRAEPGEMVEVLAVRGLTLLVARAKSTQALSPRGRN